MYFLECTRFFSRILLFFLLFNTGYASQKNHIRTTTPADTAEHFNAFRKAIEGSINIKSLIHKDSDYSGIVISQQDAQQLVQEARDKVMAIIKPYTKEIMVPRSANDSTQVSYRVIDFKKLGSLTPEQAKALFEANKSNRFAGPQEFGSIAHKYPELLQAALGDIAAQLVMFDSEARSQLSQLLINWFTVVSKEISGFLELFKGRKYLFPLFGDDPRGFIDAVEKIRAKARQYEHNAAPYLALWSIIVQGIFSENKYTLFFDELPHSDAIKAAYNNALQAFNVKEALGKLLENSFVDEELVNRLLTNDLAVWAVVGILFTPNTFEQTFVAEPLKQQEQERKQWADKRDVNNKAYESNRARFHKLMASNPDIIESDFSAMVHHGDPRPLDEKALNERVSERKAWLAKHPEAIPQDFDNSMRMYWILRGLNEEPNNSSEETVLPKFIQARKNWVQKYPGAVPEDFYDLNYWTIPGLLEEYFAKRKSWLAQNPGKTRNDYYREYANTY